MFAYLMLFGWSVVPAIVQGITRNPAKMVVITVIGGYLILPHRTVVNLPVLPQIDKVLVPSLAALIVGALAVGGARAMQAHMRPGIPAPAPTPEVLPGWVPKSPYVKLLLAILIGGVFVSALQNGDRLTDRFGGAGISVYDSFSFTLAMLVALIPFVLGRKYLAGVQAHRILLVGLAVSGAFYALPALYEVRMSPQISRMVYGFFPHNWLQHVRGGGFRPVVFLEHALWLSIFLSMASIAALSLLRAGAVPRLKLLYAIAVLGLLGTLVLGKSLGGLLIALLLGGVILFTPARVHLWVAAAVAAIFLNYPTLRAADVLPIQQIVAVAERIDTNRAASLAFRIDHEDRLLDRALERPTFGWSGFGRARVVNEDGRDISVSDGFWIIQLGESGWVGYTALVGLLSIPLVILTWRRQTYDVDGITAGVGLVLAASLIDMVPNDTLTPVTWLVAGALAGRVELGAATAKAPEPGAAGAEGLPVPPRSPGYNRPAGAEPVLDATAGPAVAAAGPTSIYTRQTSLHARRGAK